MFLVKAENILNGRKFEASFESEAEASSWIQKHVNNGSWGKAARQVVKDVDSYDESLVISEFEDEQGTAEGETITRTIISLKAEYTYSGPTEINGSGSTPEDKKFRMENAKAKAAQFKVFKDFGETVELFFTSLINERGYTQAQKDAIQSDADVLTILAELKFGRIAKCKGLIDAKNSDESLFYAADLSQVSQLMADFLEDYPLLEQ